MHTARDQIVSCALRRRLDQRRRLDVEEPLSREELTDHLDDCRAKHDLVLQLRTAEVKIPVAKSQILSRVDAVLNEKRGRLRLGENAELSRRNLNRSCLHMRIDRAASPDRSDNCDRGLGLQGAPSLVRSL